MEHEDSFKEHIENMRFKRALERVRINDINKHILNGYFTLETNGELTWTKNKQNWLH